MPVASISPCILQDCAAPQEKPNGFFATVSERFYRGFCSVSAFSRNTGGRRKLSFLYFQEIWGSATAVI